MHKLWTNFYRLLVLLCILVIWLGVQTARTMYKENTLSEPLVLQLERGDSLRAIGNKLVQLKLLDNPEHFVWWVKLHGDSRHLQAGDYQIMPKQTLAQLMRDMVAGKVQEFPVTLVEGWNFRQMMQMINQQAHIKHTLIGLDPAAIMTALGHTGEHPEGRFFPDTYHVRNQEKDIELLQRAYYSMSQTLDTLWQARADRLPYENSYQALIMASIIEKETAVGEERALIAGVFVNRLRLGMRLQTDPTVIYGIGENYDGDIRYRDLRTDTPYNTYTRKGLPPTPIAMPGYASIQAALHPADTDYLYFVAHNDGSGRHFFSSTLEEHQKMVDLNQRKR
jgi:UPF0755 protein